MADITVTGVTILSLRDELNDSRGVVLSRCSNHMGFHHPFLLLTSVSPAVSGIMESPVSHKQPVRERSKQEIPHLWGRDSHLVFEPRRGPLQNISIVSGEHRGWTGELTSLASFWTGGPGRRRQTIPTGQGTAQAAGGYPGRCNSGLEGRRLWRPGRRPLRDPGGGTAIAGGQNCRSPHQESGYLLGGPLGAPQAAWVTFFLWVGSPHYRLWGDAELTSAFRALG